MLKIGFFKNKSHQDIH